MFQVSPKQTVIVALNFMITLRFEQMTNSNFNEIATIHLVKIPVCLYPPMKRYLLVKVFNHVYKNKYCETEVFIPIFY